VTRGWLPQRAGSLGLNGGGTATAVPPYHLAEDPFACSDIGQLQLHVTKSMHASELGLGMYIISICLLQVVYGIKNLDDQPERLHDQPVLRTGPLSPLLNGLSHVTSLVM